MKIGTLLAIVLFSLVALAHLLRLLMGWAVQIDEWLVPLWVSVVGVVLPAGIAFLLIKDAR